MAESGTYDEATLARRYAMAQKLLTGDKPPIRHWAEGLGNMAEAALGGYQLSKLDDERRSEKAKGTSELYSALGLPAPAVATEPSQGGFQKLAALLSGGSAGAPASPPVGSLAGLPSDQASYPAPAAPAALPTTFRPGITAPAAPAATAGAPDYSKAIAGIESGGAYDKLGPVVKSGDRAYGKYQVMGNNIPEWTTQVLGKPMTPAEFLANPDAQEAVFKAKFGDYAQKYGPEGAAKAWFAGEKGMNNPNAKDVLGTTVAGYADKFNRALGGPPPEITTGQSIPPSSGPGAVFNSLDAAANNQPTAAPQIASALTAAPPMQSAAPAGSILANVSQENKLQIARLLSSNNPTARAMGTALLQQAVKPSEFGFQTLPDGTIVRTNPRTGTVEPTYQAPTKQTFGIIGESEDGKKTYGFIDPGKGKVTPVEPAKPGDERPTVIGPDGKEIVIPKGVDVKTFKNEVSKATADAATGKKTEVQGAAEQFANRMEESERNFKGLETQTSGLSGVTQTVAGKVPVVGNFAQTKDFQKMEQAKRTWVTALLRKESGAAIGQDEYAQYDKQFFPQPGDAPEVIAQKAEARRVAVEAMKKTAGPSYKSPDASKTAPARVTKTIGGKNYYQENGQWFEE